VLLKIIYIYETRQHAKKSDVFSQFLQQSMAFLGETSSQTIVNSSLGFIFPNESMIHNDNGVYFQTSTPVVIRVPNTCDFATLKTRIHNTLQLTDKQFLDEIYHRQPFTDTGNQIRFQCMQLKNEDDVNTMLMCNHQFSCVGSIELLCTTGRTPDGILNILEGTMTLLMMRFCITTEGGTCHAKITL